MSERLTKDDRQAEREQEPPKPLRPDAADPQDPEPHHALSNPADEPDPTEYPDPYDRRPDPKGPGQEEPAAPSTSEPHPPRNRDDLKSVKGSREGG
jgi:hypothetical protein